MYRLFSFFFLIVFTQACSTVEKPSLGSGVDLTQSAETLASAIQSGKLTSEALVAASLARIEALDKQGPAYQAIISLNENALAEARQLDVEAAIGQFRGSLHGLPVLVKDTIETRELPTTAGSLALVANDTGRDAPVVARLRAEGAIILGKANLSEWSNFKSSDAPGGWSALGGQTRNAVNPGHSPCGSSAGSAVALGVFFAPLALGAETSGSITSPAACNGIVGFKPTVGLVSRTRIIPISSSQDSAGPMARTVRDVALLLNVMAGTDTADSATHDADARKENYLASIEQGVSELRIGVFRWAEGRDERVSAVFNKALKRLEDQGAVLVDIDAFSPDPVMWNSGERLLHIEFKHGLNAYLASAADGVPVRSLDELIAFNKARIDQEPALSDQSIFLEAVGASKISDPEYLEMAKAIRRAAGENGIDNLLTTHDVSVLVMPSTGLPSSLDPDAAEDARGSPIGASWLSAMAGYPSLSVPSGDYEGLPIGLMITGTAWDDALILRVGRALERAIAKEQRAKAASFKR